MFGDNATLTNALSVSIDWIAFTTVSVKDVSEVFSFLGYQSTDFLQLPKGANGYMTVYRLKGYPVSVMADGTECMGIHVVITGSAIRDVMEHYQETLMTETPFGGEAVELSDFGNTIMTEFLRDVQRIGWFTRLDLAIDDRGCRYFTLDDVRRFLDRQEVVSKFRTFRDVCESTLSLEPVGRTIYLGSRQSEVMLRVYDKMLERNRKIEDEKERLLEPWVRWELELKNQRANIAADMLVKSKSLGEVVTGILNNYVRIIIPDDSNRSRCSLHPLWAEFVETIKKLRLYVEKAGKTIKEKRSWLVRSVLPTLAGVIIADGGCFDIITDHFDDAVARMSGHMQTLVTQACPGWRSDWNSGPAWCT